jgi:hypothetical protein
MSKATTNFAGLNGFVWWMGVVKNRADPLGLGRCKVRIFGWHTDNVTLIPDADLPWATPMNAINTSKTFGVPELNDWVVGFFLDGENGQFPVMMGVLPGIRPVEQAGYAI